MATGDLTDLIARAKFAADLRNSDSRVSDAEWTTLINSSAKELWDLLLTAHEDYFTASSTVAVVAGTDTYPLTGFSPKVHKLRGVDVLDGSNYLPLGRFDWEDRGRFVGEDGFDLRGTKQSLRYCYRGSGLVLAPVPQAAETLKVHYLPVFTELAGAASPSAEIVSRGWEEYVVLDAAISALHPEESDVSVLAARKSALETRIRETVMNLDAEQVPRMRRIRRRDIDRNADGIALDEVDW